MTKSRKDSALDRRQFLAATGGLLAASVPGATKLADAMGSPSPHASSAPSPGPSGSLRKIPPDKPHHYIGRALPVNSVTRVTSRVGSPPWQMCKEIAAQEFACVAPVNPYNGHP